MELTENQKLLLASTISELSTEIQNPDNSDLRHVRQCAFDLFLPDTNESVQVQITITRDESDYLGFLETEHMS